MSGLNILIACEASGTLRDRFRNAGHNAWSCDLLGPGSEPEGFDRADWASVWVRQKWSNYHLEGDCRWFMGPTVSMLNGKPWDIVIAHPPCTYLTNSGVRWLYDYRGKKDKARWEHMRLAAQFFNDLHTLGKYARLGSVIENPIMHGHARSQLAVPLAERLTQVVQPWMFGTPETKATVLWLDRLPPLYGLYGKEDYEDGEIKGRVHFESPRKNRWWFRSLTDPLMAETMVVQWAGQA